MIQDASQEDDAKEMSNECEDLEIVLDRLTKLHPKLIDLGLGRTLALSEKCGSPHLLLPPTIHIAGTNGKGSVAAFLRALCESAGLKAHVYNSPHLCRFNERIRLAGKLIGDAELIALLREVEEVNGDSPITFFESTTIAAFLGFSRHPADILILETGLGGKFDSTNILPDIACSIITPIALDHEYFLGRDITEIARQKAGIMHPHRPTIWAKQTSQAERGLAESAKALDCPTYLEGRDFTARPAADGQLEFIWQQQRMLTPAPSLYGAHQYQNAGLALASLMVIEPRIPINKAKAGIAQAIWPGRIQKLDEGILPGAASRPYIWLDGAHNAHGAEALIKSLMALHPHKWNVIFGALNTRPVADFISQLAPICHKLYTLCVPEQPASLTAEELSACANHLDIDSQPFDDIIAACHNIKEQGESNPHPVIICGSLYLAGAALRANGTLPA